MTPETLNCLKDWFKDYVTGFYTDNPVHNEAIGMKETHAASVCENILNIGKRLGMPEKDLLLAEAAALFHDIGRFLQYRKYKTYQDRLSDNHARLGLQQMAAHKVLRTCAKDEKRIIIKSVFFHNTIALPASVDERTLFFMRLVRDADKLDIWEVYLNFYQEREKESGTTLDIDLPDEPQCSKKIIESLHMEKLARMEHLKTSNDFKLLQIGWVFDLNFTPSFQEVLDRKVIDRLAAHLPRSAEVSAAVQHAREYVKKQLVLRPGNNIQNIFG